MDVRSHPEFDLYHRDEALVATCRRAVAKWMEEGEAIVAADGVAWTPERARAFVEEVSALFRAYNLVLWQSFSYCRRCQGGCCVSGASQVTAFDALALALLDEPFPDLAPRAAEGDCIYLGEQGCRWPQAWRPIKCWAFYCLGSGDWEIDAQDARYTRITEALQATVQEYLPAYLQGNEETLHEFLADPITFADALGKRLYDIFVAPFALGYGLTVEEPTDVVKFTLRPVEGSRTIEEARAFIAGAVETLWQDGEGSETVADEQFLADLESLEWILAQRPPNAREAIRALSERYADSGEGDGRPGAQMGLILQKLLRDPALPPVHSP